MHRVDPRTIDAHMIRNVPHGIDTLRPWRYPRSETGTTRNFAVRFRAQFASKDDYLRSIHHARLGHEHYTVKSYIYSFPKLPSNASLAQICAFIHQIVRHGSGYSVYVPPFPTMTHENHTGLWYPDLPAHCHDYWQFYDQVLHQALTGSGANLAYTESTKHLTAEFSGYQIIWLLANIAGHPGVSTTVMQPSMPYQGRNTTFHDYMQAWTHFLHLEHCRGVAYSDVYFVETFLEHLHHTFNDTLKPLILSLLRDCRRDQAVPIHFSPEHLLTYMCSRAHSIGLNNLTPLTTPNSLSTSSRRSSSTTTASTRQLTIAPVDIRLLDQEIPDDIYASVCSLMAANASRSCDICNDTNHMVATCPVLHRIIADPTKVRRLLSALERGRQSRGGSTNSPSPPHSTPTRQVRASTPTKSNRRAALRQLTMDDDNDTDEEFEVRQLTDDEEDDTSPPDASPDFL